MANYPNRKVLNEALDIYYYPMCSFIVNCLRKVKGRKVEDLIDHSLGSDQRADFNRKLQKNNTDIKSAIDLNYFAPIIRHNWKNVFEQVFLGIKLEVRSAVGLITEARNRVSHRDGRDIDSEDTRVYLFHIAKVLGYINASDIKQKEIEDIRNQLFADNAYEHVADVSDQLETTGAENANLEKLLKDKSDRLEEMEAERATYEKRVETESIKLKITEAGKTVAEERLSDISNQLEEEKTELEKRLETISDRLKDVSRENAGYQKRVETISDQLEIANAEKAKYKKVIKAASNQLAVLKRTNAQLEKRLETTLTRLEEVEAELADCKADKVPDPLPQNTNIPDFVTFQGTTFTKHFDEYYVAGDDITQSFWYYWQSQGREGKQEMRDAGWSVEKVNGEWEVTISPEDFRAWIQDEVTELNSLLDSSRKEEPSTQSTRPSYERTSLPTVKEMVQPALELFADRKEHRRVEMINLLTEHFSLDDDERRYLSKTGQAEKHLMNEGLIERTRTGYYQITTYGIEVVNDVPF